MLDFGVDYFMTVDHSKHTPRTLQIAMRTSLITAIEVVNPIEMSSSGWSLSSWNLSDKRTS